MKYRIQNMKNDRQMYSMTWGPKRPQVVNKRLVDFNAFYLINEYIREIYQCYTSMLLASIEAYLEDDSSSVCHM